MSAEHEARPPTADYRYRGIRLTSGIAKTLLQECFNEGSLRTFKRSDAVAEVKTKHLARGGLPAEAEESNILKKALQHLQAIGAVEQAGAQMWRVLHASHSSASETIDAVIASSDPEPPPVSRFVIEDEIGSGAETVYVYFSANDRKLAHAECRDWWECKIGMTKGGVDSRILGQHLPTSLHSLPIVGLAIRTDDAAQLEKMVHRLLQRAGTQILNTHCGSEWFLTSPARVRRIVEQIWSITTEVGIAQEPDSPSTSVAEVRLS